MTDMLGGTLNTLFPLFVVIGGGFFLSRAFNLSEDTLVRIVTDFFMPILVFNSLYSARLESGKVASILGATIFVILTLLALSYLYAKIFDTDSRSFIPPVIFMNSGFLGIPLMNLWGGILPMNMIVIYDQIQTFFIFTLGILIVSGGFSWKGLREMLLSPLLWAILLGFAARYSGMNIPRSIINIMDFAGNPAPSLAAFALGSSLSNRRLIFDRHIVSSILLRFVFGFLAGYLATLILNIDGILKTVVIVASSLPSAVFSFVLPMRYDVKSEHPGSMVFLSTILSLVTIPASFALAALL